ncbi:hypothetical protein Bccel_2206 [Pseudobacteroides cellulosolvens ATCC 35603 = DSM 2933]|uniref:TRAG family protein n=2 Tax=Pseudobacteroides cellulosolvens TaxID=35825 RepID=A0A0L6JMB5_9FIRM|nr:hypothetical protein Bccel_2206 [Pseudobacteroides cellulosolvens ATCC 35603 = DSM 2933]
MKTKAKLIICTLIFTIGGLINIFFTTSVHSVLSRQSTTLKLFSVMECLKSMANSKQHLMLFLFFQGLVVVMAVMFFFTNLRPYQSNLVEITPEIKTPVPVGQYQHGSARWLKDEEKDKVFDSFVLDKNAM